MNKKVLIFFPGPLLLRHGGPFSVLYHLKQGLEGMEHAIDFLSDIVPQDIQPANKVSPIAKGLKKLIKPIIPKQLINSRRIKKWFDEVFADDVKAFAAINIHQYDILHFHTSFDLWRFSDLIKTYKGKIILTSHSPKPYHLEVLEDVMHFSKEDISLADYKRLEEIDRYAYRLADVLVFPCAESTEPYMACWPLFSEVLKQKNVQYIPTGIIDLPTSKDPSGVLQQFEIPSNAFVASFIGRKLAVKGYDLVVDLAKRLLPLHDDLYFLIVGTKSEKPFFSHPRFIETGWSDDPMKFVSAVNLHLVPNRYSNFDLNILEVMSIGKPILLSNTGGNKHFQKFDPEGMFYHETALENFVQAFEECKKNKAQLELAGHRNRELYLQHFTAGHFAEAHIAFYNSF